MSRIFFLFEKFAREQKRDLWVLGLTLAFAPLFVLIYWLMTNAGGSTAYSVLIINQDIGEYHGNESINAGSILIDRMKVFSYENGSPLLKPSLVNNRQDAIIKLQNRDSALLIIIPPDFSKVLLKTGNDQNNGVTSLEFVGDMTNPTYTIAAISAMTVADIYINELSEESRPVKILETAIGDSIARTEFENYIPGLFIFAVILMVFQSSMMLVRETEGGKLIRLRIAGVSSFELLAGISSWLVVVSFINVVLTFGTAVVFGFTSQGSLALALLIVFITSLSVIAVGLMVASFARSVSQAFVIANFPLGFLMFFSGAVFPLPKSVLFTLFGHSFVLNDILPTTHGVTALNKIFTLGAHINDIWFELIVLTILTILYFWIGVICFNQIKLKS